MSPSPELRRQGEAALATLDRIAKESDTERPSEVLAEAVRHTVQLRDLLIARRRAGHSDGTQDWLDRTNAVLSLLVGAEYPIKAFHWTSVCQARDELRRMVGGR